MEAYERAGADFLFVKSPESPEEMARIAKHFDKPVLINDAEDGRTPLLGQEELAQMGFKLAIFPATAFLERNRL